MAVKFKKVLDATGKIKCFLAGNGSYEASTGSLKGVTEHTLEPLDLKNIVCIVLSSRPDLFYLLTFHLRVLNLMTQSEVTICKLGINPAFKRINIKGNIYTVYACGERHKVHVAIVIAI